MLEAFNNTPSTTSSSIDNKSIISKQSSGNSVRSIWLLEQQSLPTPKGSLEEEDSSYKADSETSSSSEEEELID